MGSPIYSRVGMVIILLLCRPGIPYVHAEAITFQQVLAEGLSNSFDRRIINKEIQAARAGVNEARADLYPQLAVQFGQEYVHVYDDVTGGDNSDIVSVGDAIAADDASGYKHSLIATAQYTLYDFGVRDLKIAMAEDEVDIAGLRERNAVIETGKKLLALYTTGLKHQEQIRALAHICDARQVIFRMAKRLHKAGALGRDQLGETALDMADEVSRLADLRIDFKKALEQISFFTRQDYPPDRISLEGFRMPVIQDQSPDFSDNPKIKLLNRQMDNKRTELRMAKRSGLPVFNLYWDWRQFGSDDLSYMDSLSNLRSRDTSLTLYLKFSLFDGFRRKARQTRLRREIEGLRIEADKKRAELQQEFSIAMNTYTALSGLEDSRKDNLNVVAKQIAYKNRLAEQQHGNQVSIQKQMIALTRQQLEIKLKQIDFAASALRVKLLMGDGS